MKIVNGIKFALNRTLASIRDAISSLEPLPPLGPVSTPSINALLLNLCEGDRDRALWVLRWLAYPLRNEGAKMATALLVAGVAGSGKSLFFDQLIAGIYGCHAVKPGERLGHMFNSWMSRKRYVLVDELRSDHVSPAALKTMITSQSIMIDGKGVQSTLERNKMNFVFLTSHVDALPAIDDCDRRFMVLTPSRVLPPAVYAAVAGEIAHGGVEAFHYFLTQQLEMDDFTTRAWLPGNAAGSMVAA
jgi:putative DNA primase/helicase